MITRRSVLKGLIAAPAVIRVAPLMKVKRFGEVWSFDPAREVYTELSIGYEITRKAINDYLYKEAFNPSFIGPSFMEMMNMTQREIDKNLHGRFLS